MHGRKCPQSDLYRLVELKSITSQYAVGAGKVKRPETHGCVAATRFGAGPGEWPFYRGAMGRIGERETLRDVCGKGVELEVATY
jgi:hypothetical protein